MRKVILSGLLFVFLGVFSFLCGLGLWFFSSLHGGFDTELRLRPPLWILMNILSFVIMIFAPTFWIFALPAYYAWRRQWAKPWRVVITVCFGIALVLDIYLLSAILLTSFIVTSHAAYAVFGHLSLT
ncbi:hypothetical protein LLE49_17540 [Alicyclobacillus tolerans]|uniref:hypothetical protein n=1 Tax=Alicyclobacillus tolerans TaxID=90970 RepID=UPI001F345AFD|nr:hypothetical protein [Alicyclobacillus tolerans]MCF8566530.1 hypothetical protein [Alicyclobacillus tolerans]